LLPGAQGVQSALLALLSLAHLLLPGAQGVQSALLAPLSLALPLHLCLPLVPAAQGVQSALLAPPCLASRSHQCLPLALAVQSALLALPFPLHQGLPWAPGARLDPLVPGVRWRRLGLEGLVGPCLLMVPLVLVAQLVPVVQRFRSSRRIEQTDFRWWSQLEE